jgi:hypothetical protein
VVSRENSRGLFESTFPVFRKTTKTQSPAKIRKGDFRDPSLPLPSEDQFLKSLSLLNNIAKDTFYELLEA